MAGTIWMTGLSGAGKSTAAKMLIPIIMKKTFVKAIVIDGDDLRNGLCSDLGFDQASRTKNLERAAHICKILNDQGFFVIATLMSPIEIQRQAAQKIIGKHNFCLLHISSSIENCEKRDPKGIYAKGRQGLITNIVGKDITFEQISLDYQNFVSISNNLSELHLELQLKESNVLNSFISKHT